MNFTMSNIFKDKHEINLSTQKFILQMCWAQHDGQWFLKTKRKDGTEVSNERNLEVIRSMSKIEAKHILNAIGYKKGVQYSIQELFKIINTILDVILPKIMKFKLYINSDKEGGALVKKCFIWEQVKKAKGEKEYNCMCMPRLQGWLYAMGVNAEVKALQLIPEGDKHCEFRFILKD